jgi:quinol monooxygenase YgiN
MCIGALLQRPRTPLSSVPPKAAIEEVTYGRSWALVHRVGASDREQEKFGVGRRGYMAVKVGVLARMQAKTGKEDDVAAFLEGALPLVNEEPDTVTWYAIRIGPSDFGIFDTFEDDAGRQAHLSGKVAQALMANAPELFVGPPQIDQVDVLASK